MLVLPFCCLSCCQLCFTIISSCYACCHLMITIVIIAIVFTSISSGHYCYHHHLINIAIVACHHLSHCHCQHLCLIIIAVEMLSFCSFASHHSCCCHLIIAVIVIFISPSSSSLSCCHVILIIVCSYCHCQWQFHCTVQWFGSDRSFHVQIDSVVCNHQATLHFNLYVAIATCYCHKKKEVMVLLPRSPSSSRIKFLGHLCICAWQRGVAQSEKA